MRKASNGAPRRAPEAAATLELKLYVAGQTPRSLAAIANLRRICREHRQNRYHVEVIDLLRNPTQALRDQIVAIPTLVKSLPEPLRKIIGDLSNTERVLVCLDIEERKAKKGAKA
jgi:circadian clock protein KaiB